MDRRYKKRIDKYWQKMEQQGFESLENIDIHGWFDYWHTHPDWDRKGNKCLENRYSTIALGYKLLNKAEKLCQKREKPIQCWATVCDDTADNAIYLHSENPNKTPFPDLFEDCTWDITNNEELNAVVDLETHEIGKQTFQNEVCYVIKLRSNQKIQRRQKDAPLILAL